MDSNLAQKNQNVRTEVRLHDRFRLEVATISRPQASGSSVDVFFFFPKPLDITASSYPKPIFYRYLKNNIRYRIPDQHLDELVREDNKYTRTILDPGRGSRDYLYALKLVSVIFTKALQSEFAVEDETSLRKSDAAARELLILLRSNAPASEGSDHLGFQQINDYCSSQFIQIYLARISRLAEGELRTSLSRAVDQEHAYRKSVGMLPLDGTRSFSKAVHKITVAQRFSESGLFLKTERKETGNFTQQFIFSLAAGIAMGFAMIITFWSQQKYGNFTVNFLLAMVLGYIVKDRLKELGRNYTYMRLGQRMHDYTTKLYSGLLQRHVGTIREVAHFVSPDKLDKELQHFRGAHRRFRKGDYENILRYSRKMNLKTMETPEWVEYYADFTVFNLRKMLRNASYQDKSFYYKKGKKVIQRRVQPSYVIELIIRISEKKEKRYERYSIEVTRKGVRKIVQGKFLKA